MTSSQASRWLAALALASAGAAVGCLLTTPLDDMSGGVPPAPDAAIGQGDSTADEPPPEDGLPQPDATEEAFPEAGFDAADAADDDAGPSYVEAVQQDQPTSWWRLNETAGSVVHDLTVNATEGQIVGTVSFAAPGALLNDPDTAMGFDGSAHLDMGSSIALANPFTIELWLKPRGPSTGYHYVAHKMEAKDGGAPINGTVLYMSDKVDYAFGFEQWSSGSLSNAVFLEQSPSTEQWHHVVVVHTGTPLLYVDGVVVKMGFGKPGVGQNTEPLVWARGLTADLDEIAIYSKALQPARILAHYKAAGY